MKSTVASKVAVLLALATGIFAATIQIKGNAALKDWLPAVPYLWALCIFFLCSAIYLAFFRKTDEEQIAQRVQRKAAIRRTIRDLKREYRATHHIPTAFTLGAEYYIQHTSLADAELIHEILEEEGEKEL